LAIGSNEKTLALVSIYSPPNQALLDASSNTLWSCTHQGDVGLKVVDVKTISSVVAMIPHGANFPGDTTGHFFVVEKPGLDVAHMGGNDEEITEE
jgi:hypothetical protein